MVAVVSVVVVMVVQTVRSGACLSTTDAHEHASAVSGASVPKRDREHAMKSRVDGGGTQHVHVLVGSQTRKHFRVVFTGP